MRHIIAAVLTCSVGALAAHSGLAAETTAGISPQAAPAIVQDRDEPGRNPYQESARVKPPSGGNPFYGVTFSKVSGGRRRVIEHVACLIIQAPEIGFAFLTDVNNRSIRDYLPFTRNTEIGISNVVINVNTRLYYFYNDQPAVRFQFAGTPGDFDCTIVGYDVPIP